MVKKHNICLTVRNTGHDYYGKPTRAGLHLAIWTHCLRDIKVLDFASPDNTEKAINMGAGVEVYELTVAGHAKDLVIVGGNCLADGDTRG